MKKNMGYRGKWTVRTSLLQKWRWEESLEKELKIILKN